MTLRTGAHFDGPDYDPIVDKYRLTKQIKRVYLLMRDEAWRSLRDIEIATGDPQSSISAQLRHLRKEKFGSHTINKKRSRREGGTWLYQLIVNDGDDNQGDLFQ